MTRYLLFYWILACAWHQGWAGESHAGESQSGKPHAGRPNIVLILADDVGREVLECYGALPTRHLSSTNLPNGECGSPRPMRWPFAIRLEPAC